MEPLDSPTAEPTYELKRPEQTRFDLMMAMPIVGVVGLMGVSLVAGLVLADRGSEATVVTIPQPVVVTTPAPVMVSQPVVQEPAKPPVRLATPMLNAACYGTVSPPSNCDWDDGFPAVSSDGREVAFLVIDGVMGPEDVSVVVLDAATQKQTRKLVIVKPGELTYGDDTVDIEFRQLVTERTAQAQHQLEGYRSLHSLGTGMTKFQGEEQTEAEVVGNPMEIHAAWLNETMRLIDPSTNTELWRHAFSAKSPKRDPKIEECNGWEMVNVAVWWDPQTHVVAANLLHHHGGCMCGSTTVRQTFKF